MENLSFSKNTVETEIIGLKNDIREQNNVYQKLQNWFIDNIGSSNTSLLDHVYNIVRNSRQVQDESLKRLIQQNVSELEQKNVEFRAKLTQNDEKLEQQIKQNDEQRNLIEELRQQILSQEKKYDDTVRNMSQNFAQQISILSSEIKELGLRLLRGNSLGFMF
eukprot:TRINITY_DN3637_c0_g1_i1.p1 TRINITY_DN3637_c0_g1~~TRINITY_DN3637_c0_g1_i1.p1  ORF type:complete len:163 (-),score=20.29 TRINITY_DN3637_c0_g1_i1:50-538(-)